jgi:excisionase family DNA binding protein
VPHVLSAALMGDPKSFQGSAQLHRFRILTVNEAAAFLRVGRTTLYGLLKSGSLPSIEIGNSRRFILDDLMEYAASLRMGAVTA